MSKNRLGKDRGHILLISIVAFLVPLYIKGTITFQTDIEAEVYRIFTSPVNIDFFGRSKLNLLSYLVIILGVQFLWYYFYRKKIQFKLSIPLLFGIGFILSLLVATMLSEYRDVALLGFSDRYEGFYAYSYYFLLMLFTAFMIRDDEDLRFILKAMMIGVVSVVAFGLLQTMDIFLIHMESLEKYWFFGADTLFIGEIDRYQAYFRDLVEPGFDIVGATLMNPNYFSVYCAVILQLAFGFYLNSRNKKGVFVYFIVVCIAFLGGLISGSKTSFYIGAIMTVLQVLWRFLEKSNLIEKVTLYNRAIKLLKRIIPLAIIYVIIFFIANNQSEGDISLELFAYKGETESASTKTLMLEKESTETAIPTKIEKESFTMISQELIAKQELEAIIIEKDKTLVRDSISEVQLVIEDGQIVIGNKDALELYSYWKLKQEDGYVSLMFKGKPLYFGIVQEEIWVYGPRGLTKDIGTVKEPMLNGHLFTYRGYTWSIVLELVKERPFFGYGPDLLTIYTPVDDLINRFNYTSGATSIAINPHNMYLQHLFNGGIATLLMFLGLVLSIYIKGLLIYIRQKDRREMLQILFFPLTTFLIVALLNDTIIGTGVILYILLGAGIYLVTE